MSHQQERNGMSTAVVLTIAHTYGLEAEELTRWLIGKANSILVQLDHQRELNKAKERALKLELVGPAINAYASLGISHKYSDPIRPLSKEVIQFEMAQSDAVLQVGCKLLTEGNSKFPLGYLSLPDLVEEQEEYQQRKAGWLDSEESLYE